MTRRGRYQKIIPAQVKDHRLIENAPSSHAPFTSIPVSASTSTSSSASTSTSTPTSNPPASSPPSSTSVSWYRMLSMDHIPSTARHHAASPSQSHRTSYRATTYNTSSNIGPASPSAPQVPDDIELPSSRRHQAIPISFLINPTHVSPQSQPLVSLFNYPPKTSSESSSQATRVGRSSLDEFVNQPVDVLSTEPYLPPPHSYPPLFEDSGLESEAYRSTSAASSKDSTLAAPIKQHSLVESGNGISSRRHSASDPKAPPEYPRHTSTLHNTRSKWSSSVITQDQDYHYYTPEGSADCAGVEPVEELTSHAEEASADHTSVRRASKPSVKTTKTGKILHRSKKVGRSRKLTAYDRFLQQRSKYLAVNRSDLSAQERMKIIAEEWAVSDKNQHKTRRKSRFLGPDGELVLPTTSSLGLKRLGSVSSSPAISSPVDRDAPANTNNASSSRAAVASTGNRRLSQTSEGRPGSVPTANTSKLSLASSQMKDKASSE